MQELCAGFELLEEILVLRLEGGAEHYIPVTGRYASHAFGAPLDQLSARHGSQVHTWHVQQCASLFLLVWIVVFMGGLPFWAELGGWLWPASPLALSEY